MRRRSVVLRALEGSSGFCAQVAYASWTRLSSTRGQSGGRVFSEQRARFSTNCPLPVPSCTYTNERDERLPDIPDIVILSSVHWLAEVLRSLCACATSVKHPKACDHGNNNRETIQRTVIPVNTHPYFTLSCQIIDLTRNYLIPPHSHSQLSEPFFELSAHQVGRYRKWFGKAQLGENVALPHNMQLTMPWLS